MNSVINWLVAHELTRAPTITSAGDFQRFLLGHFLAASPGISQSAERTPELLLGLREGHLENQSAPDASNIRLDVGSLLCRVNSHKGIPTSSTCRIFTRESTAPRFRALPAGFLYPGDKGFNGNSGIQSRWGKLRFMRQANVWDPKGDGSDGHPLSGAGIAARLRALLQNPLINNEAATLFAFLTVDARKPCSDNPWQNYPGGDPYPYNFSKTNPAFPYDAGYLWCRRTGRRAQRSRGTRWSSGRSTRTGSHRPRIWELTSFTW